MKKLFLILTLGVLVCGLPLTGHAAAILYDWYVDVGSTRYEVYPDTYKAPSTGGYITGVTGFDPFSTPYAGGVYAGPYAYGSVKIDFKPGVAGSYTIGGYFDAEIDEWVNTYLNEAGSVVGSGAASQSGSILNPLGQAGDIAMLMNWDFALQADETAHVLFSLSANQPTAAFYLKHWDLDTGEAIYLSSTFSITGGGPHIPEPGTLMLLGTGLVGLLGWGRKGFKA